MSAPVPFPFLWTLDLGFGTWIWDLNLGLGFGTVLGLDIYHFEKDTNTRSAQCCPNYRRPSLLCCMIILYNPFYYDYLYHKYLYCNCVVTDSQNHSRTDTITIVKDLAAKLNIANFLNVGIKIDCLVLNIMFDTGVLRLLLWLQPRQKPRPSIIVRFKRCQDRRSSDKMLRHDARLCAVLCDIRTIVTFTTGPYWSPNRV